MATLVEAPEEVVQGLARQVAAEGASLPEKYRVLFSLRNVAGLAATQALIAGASSCLHSWCVLPGSSSSHIMAAAVLVLGDTAACLTRHPHGRATTRRHHALPTNSAAGQV
jgi:hypothetical protein